MCILVDDIEDKYKNVPEISTICEDWRRERMKVLETTPMFERIHWPLIELDRRFGVFVSYALEFAGYEGDLFV